MAPLDIFRKTPPIVGMGTSRSDPAKLSAALQYGMEIGYQIIDSAFSYENAAHIGSALKEVLAGGTIQREDVYLVYKSSWTALTLDDMMSECKAGLEHMGVDYFDLYLLHTPMLVKKGSTREQVKKGEALEFVEDNFEQRWRALEMLVKEGLVKAIGVSNFSSDQISRILDICEIPPSVNECEATPYFPNSDLVKYCQENNIMFFAYAPVGSGSARQSIFGGPAEGMNLFEEPILQEISKRHGKTISQVVLRWAAQRGTIPITKSLSPEHIEENLDIADFELSAKEMNNIGRLARLDGRIFSYQLFKDSKEFRYFDYELRK